MATKKANRQPVGQPGQLRPMSRVRPAPSLGPTKKAKPGIKKA